MRHSVKHEVQRFELEGGDWVDLATRLTFLERRTIEKALAGKTLNGAASIELGDLDHAAGNVELLLQVVKAWGGPGFCERDEHPHDGDCSPTPITRAVVEGLDEVGDLILLELQRRMVGPTPDFTQPPSPPSSTAVAAESTQLDS